MEWFSKPDTYITHNAVYPLRGPHCRQFISPHAALPGATKGFSYSFFFTYAVVLSKNCQDTLMHKNWWSYTLRTKSSEDCSSNSVHKSRPTKAFCPPLQSDYEAPATAPAGGFPDNTFKKKKHSGQVKPCKTKSNFSVNMQLKSIHM